MKTHRWMVFAGPALLLVGMMLSWIPARPGHAQDPRPQQAVTWEYKVVKLPTYLNGYEQVYNELGKQGWEYCATHTADSVDETSRAITTNVHYSVFKRAGKRAP